MSTDTTEIEAEHTTCTNELKNMQIKCTEEEVDACASCGKEGSNLNICNKCKDAKYCNAACKKKHRSKHKKKCERRVAELHDIELFKQPLTREDCPICMLPLSLLHTGRKYYSCCGKIICSGCIHAISLRDKEEKCPFCRAPSKHYSDQEIIKRLQKRMEAEDAIAMFNLGCYYDEGLFGLPQDYDKALELWHRAGEFGYAKAYNNIGNTYYNGEGVERDEKKADHYYELAAMGGDAGARGNLGSAEARAGNWDRAIKHFMISVGGGDNDSVKIIQQLYRAGHATKDDYAKALLVYQVYLEEVKSPQRDQAAVFHESHKYY